MTSIRKLMGTAALVFALSAGFAANVASAQVRTETVQFPSGKNQVKKSGRITGDQSVRYVVNARSGQQLAVSMWTDNKMAYFNILPPGSSEAIFIGQNEARLAFDQQVNKSGAYTIDVYLIRAAARRGEKANYEVTVMLEPGRGAQSADFADGLAGGPNYWIVTGVQGRVKGNRLPAHTSPSKSAPAPYSFVDGTPLTNKGCKMVADVRWCMVAMRDVPAEQGWVLGQYLREYAGN